MNNKLLSRELLALTNACGATNLRHTHVIGHVEKCIDLIGRDKILSPAQLRVRTRRYQTLPPPTKGLARETMHELLADFDFQRSKVNFYELKSVVARLIDSIRYVRERKNPLGQL